MARPLTPLTLALAASLLASTGSVLAETPEPADPGRRVRLTVPDLAKKPLVGTLAAVDHDTVLLHLDRRPEPVRIQRSQVTRWEVSRGRKSNVLRSTGWGLVAGAGVGTILMLATLEDDGLFSPGEAVAMGAGFFGGIGAGVGALVGLHKTDRWEEVEGSSFRLGLMPVPAGVGLAVHWSSGADLKKPIRPRVRTSPAAAAGPPQPTRLEWSHP